MLADVGIVCAIQRLFRNSDLLKKSFSVLAELVCLIDHRPHFLTVFFFISHYFQGLVLNLLDIQMAFLLIFQNLQPTLQCLYFILLRLDSLVIVYALQLPLRNENASLHILDLYLLLLHLQLFLPYQLILLFNFGQPNPIIFLFGPIPQQNLIELLGQLVYLGLQFDVLLNEPLLLVLPRNQPR
jgi:hypothetical protein